MIGHIIPGQINGKGDNLTGLRIEYVEQEFFDVKHIHSLFAARTAGELYSRRCGIILRFMTDTEITAAVIGTGHLGRHHVRILAGMEGVRCIGAFDMDRERLAEITTEHGVPALESLEEAEREAQRRAAGVLDRIADPDRKRIRGLLAELLEVREGFEPAVEAVLATRLNSPFLPALRP